MIRLTAQDKYEKILQVLIQFLKLVEVRNVGNRKWETAVKEKSKKGTGYLRAPGKVEWSSAGEEKNHPIKPVSFAPTLLADILQYA
jgi:hypothetical protein